MKMICMWRSVCSPETIPATGMQVNVSLVYEQDARRRHHRLGILLDPMHIDGRRVQPSMDQAIP